MGQIDTTSFARFLSNGLQTGINMGENADRLRLQRDHLAQQQEQDSILNAARLEQFKMQVEEREREVLDRQRSQDAIKLGVSMFGQDDATFQQSVQANSEQLKYAPAGMVSAIFNKQQGLQEYKKAEAQLQQAINSGWKLDEDNVKRFTNMGLMVPDSAKAKSVKEKDEQQRASDRDRLTTAAALRGEITNDDANELIKIHDHGMYMAELTRLRTLRANEKQALAEQQAAKSRRDEYVQKNLAAGFSQTEIDRALAGQSPTGDFPMLQKQAPVADPNVVDPALDRYRNGQASSSDLRILKDAGYITAGAIDPAKGESASAVRAALNQRISAAKNAYDMALKELEPLAKAVQADVATGKVPDSVSGKGFWNVRDTGMDTIIPAYEAAKAKAEQAKRTYEALNQQALGGGAIDGDITQQKRARASELKAQGVPLEQARSILLQEFGE